MKDHGAHPRKIDPTQGALLGDGTTNLADRVEIGPTPLAFAEWRAAGLALPDLARMRAYRLDRLRDAIAARDYGGLLLFDPLNIRYATDSTNMQLWNAHNPFRAVLVCADGYMVIWDYRPAMFLTEHLPLVAEVRTGADLFYFDRGDGLADAARAFAGEVAALLAAHGGSRRIGCDKPMIHALRALEAAGLEVMPGEEATEKARAVKGPDEIAAMRCAIHACEAAMAEMEDFARDAVPRGSVTEADIWAVLHAANIRRGGEWIETRLLTSGPRTNPWFQECGPREVSEGEILAFDTDLIGPYGICADLSRTWWLGDGPARPDMIDAMRHALDHIRENAAMLRPGVSLRDLTFGAHVLRPEFQRQKYGCLIHGVGLCDEWPLIVYPDHHVPGAFDAYVLEPGMTLCVEALVSPEGGDFSIKLEDQVLITEDGVENLTRYPFDPRLTG
ncbi:dimethylsulfonioproprionate lyase DddP [Jannaschia ovalis]|uniref:Xaa-Pro peptidase family protein n=1 Tax=Jannaschia ovalis TaxID=3038773 RepID=A0ABY8LCB3_9RHOB|nr:dimethylsulfonioproprionate lyase DddP [Jannaschia sp. GRR-S6-38]WGH78970.1 Xaa-Pro peptidase family protein [Jannaschia sp. GRR-S6-38]